MKTINKFLAAGLVASSLVGCKDRMIELNTNPNTVSSTTMPYLFTGATSNFGYTSRDQAISNYQGMQIMQIAATYNTSNPYNNPLEDGGTAVSMYANTYSQYFSNFGNKLQTILNNISYEQDPTIRAQYNDVEAIVKIVMAYDQWRVAEQYGAMVYEEAFKAITEGIRFPKYQLGKDIYKSIDQTLKEAIEVLSQPAVEGTVELGANDYFYGYINTPSDNGGSVASTLGNYETQRARWMKLANAYRLEMAWKLQAYDAAHFSTVLAEVTAVANASGVMTSNADGFYYNYPSDYDNNPDDVNAITVSYGASSNFVNTLKTLEDPRLPFLVRPNGLSSQNSTTYRLMQQYFPDSLAKYPFLADGNIYVGQTPNPKFQDQMAFPAGFETAANPGLIGAQLKTFKLNVPAGATLPYDYVITKPDGTTETYTAVDAEFSATLQVVSPVQGRYYIKAGGKDGQNYTANISSTVNELYYDGQGGVTDGLLLRRELYSYARQCFLFANLNITIGGKTGEEWYREGIVAAMSQLKDDASRYAVQIAVNSSYPRFAGVNPDGTYTYDDAAIAAYAAAQPFNANAVMTQSWIAAYQCPEYIYQWYKVTGLPQMVDINTPADAMAQTSGYLVQPYADSDVATKLLVPRRNQLPDQSSVNNENYTAIRTTLEAEPGYGGIMNNTSGQVWWDYARFPMNN